MLVLHCANVHRCILWNIHHAFTNSRWWVLFGNSISLGSYEGVRYSSPKHSQLCSVSYQNEPAQTCTVTGNCWETWFISCRQPCLVPILKLPQEGTGQLFPEPGWARLLEYSQVVLHTLSVPKENPVTSFIHTDVSSKHLGFSSKEHLLV